MSTPTNIPHPGTRIKAEVIPSGMSVTKAAQIIGVGRPALSNLLNGNASLSPDMAARLSKAFQCPIDDLLEMQASYDAAQAKQKETPANTKSYVPPFLEIKANAIEDWVSNNIAARSRLSVFLRTLINSTGNRLTKVDFPGNDDAERPGWDGFVDAEEATQWIPLGQSGWEFGTNVDPKGKADSDYDKSIKAHNQQELANITFVFVTPRRWNGKSNWVIDKRKQGLWKDVRAYDASDLEQWLEQSLSAQAWFANETRIPAQDIRSLDQCWADWANVSEPPLTGSLFSPAIDATKRIVQSRLSKPVEAPIIIAADSTEEALAFLSQLLSENGGEELALHRDRVLVFDKPGALPRLAMAAQSFIAVAFTREVEKEFAPYTKSIRSFVIYPRNASTTQADIVLEPVNYETFNKSLEEMGKSRDEIARFTKESGRSLTVLRRRLSAIPAVQTPEWASNHALARSLVPFMFVGSWNYQNETDKTGLSLLAGDRCHNELEAECQSLTRLNDAPMWSIGTFRGVVSKLDLLYAIAGVVTSTDLEQYFEIASLVLGEDDPALDLEEDQRWTAQIYGKTREFSGSFRKGIAETLVLLAVHGNDLFKHRLGVDMEVKAAQIVRDLLPKPLTTRALEANNHDLPTYAEAAPDEFLSILERDLKSESPAVFGLMRPVTPGLFGASPGRTGLLWALEGLAWNPATLTRTALILARLSEIQINDNLVNKPINSLKSIFSARMPQTAVDHHQRVALLKKIIQKYPSVAWQLCIEQFGNHLQSGGFSHKPRWRQDGYGFGNPLPTREPIIAFVREVVEMVLTWKEYSLDMLGDLVERLHGLSEDDQNRVWSLIEAWAKEKASDEEKVVMREKIRVSTLSRRALMRAKRSGKSTNLTSVGINVYAALESSDVICKHFWLFRNHWVDESADEIEDIDTIDFNKRDERITNLRKEALREIFATKGVDGVLELSQRGNAAWVIGVLSVNVLLEPELNELLSKTLAPILSSLEDIHPNKNLISGALRAIEEDNVRETVIRNVAECLSEEDTVKLLMLAPYCRSTWNLVDNLSNAGQTKYWNEITPNWLSDVAESTEAVERLLRVNRPRAAFSCIELESAKFDASLLFRVLTEIARGGNEQTGQHMLDQYHIGEAFKQINGSLMHSLEDKAGLEFAYIDILGKPRDLRGDYGIPNLEIYVEQHPELFVQAICWTYRRNDGASDPIEIQIAPENIQVMAHRGHNLLEGIERIPGHNELGELKSDNLAKWIDTVRKSCTELGRADVADSCIGKVLSHSVIGKDGIWPCEQVRDVIEDIQSESMMSGLHTGVYNSRGVVCRGEGGNQERELADKYRKWGLALQISHPFVAAKLLMDLANTYDREANREDINASINRRMLGTAL